MAKVEEISERAPFMSSCARYIDSLLRIPLPNPMSKLSIHNNILLIVSQTPLLYSPRHFKVIGTDRNTTTADHPFSRKDATTFLVSRFDLLFIWSIL